MENEIKVQKPALVFGFNMQEAVRDMKVFRAQCEHHIKLCDDLPFAHWLEDEMKTLIRKAETKREELQGV